MKPFRSRIISASRRTDIPAFYSDWFINRIREGYALVQNPFNAKMFSRVDLSPARVDVVVFWTRNARPILRHLDELSRNGYRYYFQYTLNGYPKILEPGVPSPSEAIAAFRDLSRAIGKEKVIWRLDPIVVSDVTSEDWICKNFVGLARQLQGFTDRVVISFVYFYTKVTRNLNRATGSMGVKFYDVHGDTERLLRIASRLSEIARYRSMSISSCAEIADLTKIGIAQGKCISDDLISSIFGITVNGQKDKYQRKPCRCISSQDIGRYDTCVHGCIYCYANSNKELSARNHASHDPSSPALFGNGRADVPAEACGHLPLFIGLQ